MSDRNWYRIEAQADDDSATVYVDDVIGWFGTEARTFVRDFDAIEASRIDIRINSPGGDVFDGVAIYNAIRRHGAHTVAHVDGLAASAASIVALAADEVVMGRGAFLMIHNPWMIVLGDVQQLNDAAETLKKITEAGVGIYSAETGNSRRRVREWMNAETWFGAEEAIANGFANREDEVEAQANAVKALSRLDFARRYEKVPEELASAVLNGRPTAADPKQPPRELVEHSIRERFNSTRISAMADVKDTNTDPTPEPSPAPAASATPAPAPAAPAPQDSAAAERKRVLGIVLMFGIELPQAAMSRIQDDAFTLEQVQTVLATQAVLGDQRGASAHLSAIEADEKEGEKPGAAPAGEGHDAKATASKIIANARAAGVLPRQKERAA